MKTIVLGTQGRRSWAILALLLIFFLMESGAWASLLVLDFKPAPFSPFQSEIVWDGVRLQTGPGAVGNADGTLPPDQQTPGGLQIDTNLFPHQPIPGAVENTTTGSYAFYDVTLELTGLTADGPAQFLDPIIVQKLSPGTFRFMSTDPDGAGPAERKLMLAGEILHSRLVGTLGSPTAALLSENYDVMYGGEGLGEAFGGRNLGYLVFSLSEINAFVVYPDNFGDLQLQPFEANATGQFGITIPESGLILAMLPISIFTIRRRFR
jgi:hypothetical protein